MNTGSKARGLRATLEGLNPRFKILASVVFMTAYPTYKYFSGRFTTDGRYGITSIMEADGVYRDVYFKIDSGDTTHARKFRIPEKSTSFNSEIYRVHKFESNIYGRHTYIQPTAPITKKIIKEMQYASTVRESLNDALLSIIPGLLGSLFIGTDAMFSTFLLSCAIIVQVHSFLKGEIRLYSATRTVRNKEHKRIIEKSIINGFVVTS